MIKKLFCFLWGHKFIIKAYTGETMTVHNEVNIPRISPMYKWEAQKFCIRCGCKNKDYEPKV